MFGITYIGIYKTLHNSKHFHFIRHPFYYADAVAILRSILDINSDVRFIIILVKIPHYERS
jgi:hypothetical protein